MKIGSRVAKFNSKREKDDPTLIKFEKIWLISNYNLFLDKIFENRIRELIKTNYCINVISDNHKVWKLISNYVRQISVEKNSLKLYGGVNLSELFWFEWSLIFESPICFHWKLFNDDWSEDKLSEKRSFEFFYYEIMKRNEKKNLLNLGLAHFS